MSQTTLGFFRGLLVVIVFAVVHFLTDAAHLNGVLSPSLAALVAMVALAIEHAITDQTGNAFFGAMRAR